MKKDFSVSYAIFVGVILLIGILAILAFLCGVAPFIAKHLIIVASVFSIFLFPVYLGHKQELVLFIAFCCTVLLGMIGPWLVIVLVILFR